MVGEEGVGGAEGEAFVETGLPGGGPGVLCREDEVGDGLVGALVFGPFLIGVFDRHGVEVGAELDGDDELGRVFAKESDGGGAQAVVVLGLELFVEQGFKRGGVGGDTELGDVVAVADGGLGVVGLGERMQERVAEEVESGARVAEYSVRGMGEAGDNALDGLRDIGGAVFQRRDLREEGFDADRIEDFAGVEHEVLGVLPGVTGEHVALDIEHFERKSAGAGDAAVVVKIARVLSQARNDRVAARRGEEALAKMAGQIPYVELAPEEAVRLGVAAAYSAAEPLTGKLLRPGHGSDNEFDGLLLVRVGVFDAGAVADVGAGAEVRFRKCHGVCG